MRILVVSDLHANPAALAAIREPFDACLCLGDLVDYGPDPGECAESDGHADEAAGAGIQCCLRKGGNWEIRRGFHYHFPLRSPAG